MGVRSGRSEVRRGLTAIDASVTLGPVRWPIGWGAGVCVAALLLAACGSSKAPANRSVSEVVSCLRAGGLTHVAASDTAVGRGGLRIVPVIVGPDAIAGILLFPSAAAATRWLGRSVPGGSSGGSVVQVGNVALIDAESPTASARLRLAAERCAFGAGASRARTYTVAGAAPSPVATGQIPPGYPPGRQAIFESGCLGCHRIGTDGNAGPGPSLSDIGRRLSRSQILTTLVDPTAPMPSFRDLPPGKLRALVVYLSGLRTPAPAPPGG